MAKTNTEPKKYAAFDGKILFAYKGSRDSGIKFYNGLHFAPKEKIPYLDWEELVQKINGIDSKTAAELEILRKQYYRKKFQMEEQLMEEMLFPAIDKLVGFDKIIEQMQR